MRLQITYLFLQSVYQVNENKSKPDKDEKENKLVDIYSVALPGEVDNYRYSGFWCLYQYQVIKFN